MDLHPAHCVPFERFKHLASRTRGNASYVRIETQNRVALNARVCGDALRLVLARQPLGDDNVNHFSARGVELNPRPPSENIPKIEQHCRASAPLNADQQRLLSTLRASGERLDGVLGDLLDLARLEAGAEILRPVATDLAGLVRDLGSAVAPRAAAKCLALTVEIDPDLETAVLCDGPRLRRLLTKLTDNALKFTGAGKIELVARREDEAVVFTVRDTGCGFDPTRASDLAQRFRQGDDSSRRADGGAGLGLAISYGYAKLMGATLTCESRPGQGSMFRLTAPLPRASLGALHDALPAPDSDAPILKEVNQPVAADASGIDEGAAPAASEQPRVLVVDDNPVNRQVLGLILSSGDLLHDEAGDGAEAVALASREPYDAILMDLQMPVMDGFEAIRRIRLIEAESGRARTPILVVSANCLDDHVDAAAAAGADGHLCKPVSPAGLFRALTPLLAGAAPLDAGCSCAA